MNTLSKKKRHMIHNYEPHDQMKACLAASIVGVCRGWSDISDDEPNEPFLLAHEIDAVIVPAPAA